MKMILISLVIFFSTIIDGQIVLDEPVEYPSNFQRLYELVESGANGWIFDECLYGEIQGESLNWDQSVDLFRGTDQDFEDRGFSMLTLLFLDLSINFCGDLDGKPILYGPGVGEFLEWYEDPGEYESHQLPILARRVVRRLMKVTRIFYGR